MEMNDIEMEKILITGSKPRMGSELGFTEYANQLEEHMAQIIENLKEMATMKNYGKKQWNMRGALHGRRPQRKR
ncbi:MAG: hypothetical protein QXF82_10895 [Nitrososphaeria archaeon]